MPLACVAPVLAQFGGPAILTRGGIPGVQKSSALAMFRPYISLTGIYDTGLTGVSLDQQGNFADASTFGIQAQGGVDVYHTWRRTVVDLNYRGTFQHYSQASYYDGTDHILGLSVSHQVSRHLQFTTNTAAGSFARNFGFFGGYTPFDPAYTTLPADEIFDNRTYYLTTGGSFVYQKSARLSFTGGGEGFFVRRRSSALFGVNGYSAYGDAGYRLSRLTTVGVAYTFMHFDFPRAFGASDMHGVMGFYARRLSPTWQVNAGAGLVRIETLSVGVVALDPVIAQLLGQRTGLQPFYGTSVMSNIQVRLGYAHPRSSFTIGYTRGVVPGNGIFLTSRRDTATASYNYSGIRNWSFTANGGYSEMASLTAVQGSYHSYQAGIGASRRIGRSVHAILRLDARHYNTSSYSNFNRILYRASVGLAFTPREIPVSLW